MSSMSPHSPTPSFCPTVLTLIMCFHARIWNIQDKIKDNSGLGVSLHPCFHVLDAFTDQLCLFGPQFPEHSLSKLNERLILFRHDYDSPNILQIINAASEVTQDTLVEIVMSGKSPWSHALIEVMKTFGGHFFFLPMHHFPFSNAM